MNASFGMLLKMVIHHQFFCFSNFAEIGNNYCKDSKGVKDLKNFDFYSIPFYTF